MFPCEGSKTLSVCPYPEKRNHHSFVNISPTLVIDTSMERSSRVLHHGNQKIWFFSQKKFEIDFWLVLKSWNHSSSSTCTYMTTSGMHRRSFEGRHLVACVLLVEKFLWHPKASLHSENGCAIVHSDSCCLLLVASILLQLSLLHVWSQPCDHNVIHTTPELHVMLWQNSLHSQSNCWCRFVEHISIPYWHACYHLNCNINPPPNQMVVVSQGTGKHASLCLALSQLQAKLLLKQVLVLSKQQPALQSKWP